MKYFLQNVLNGQKRNIVLLKNLRRLTSTIGKNVKFSFHVCFTDLDQGRETIIFASMLTIFIGNVIFKGIISRGSKNWLEFKIEPSLANPIDETHRFSTEYYASKLQVRRWPED